MFSSVFTRLLVEVPFEKGLGRVHLRVGYLVDDVQLFARVRTHQRKGERQPQSRKRPTEAKEKKTRKKKGPNCADF